MAFWWQTESYADQIAIREASIEVSEKGFLRAWGHTSWPWRRGGAGASRSSICLQSTPGNHSTYSCTQRVDMLNSSNLYVVLSPTIPCSLQAVSTVIRCAPFRSWRRRRQPSSNGEAKTNICNSKGSLAEVKTHVFIAVHHYSIVETSIYLAKCYISHSQSSCWVAWNAVPV